MSYTNSQKRALCSDWLCLLLCVLALCLSFYTVSVNYENELQYQALDEESSAYVWSTVDLVNAVSSITGDISTADPLFEYGTDSTNDFMKKL